MRDATAKSDIAVKITISPLCDARSACIYTLKREGPVFGTEEGFIITNGARVTRRYFSRDASRGIDILCRSRGKGQHALVVGGYSRLGEQKHPESREKRAEERERARAEEQEQKGRSRRNHWTREKTPMNRKREREGPPA